MQRLSDNALLSELEPAVAAALDRHLALVQEWFPHEYVPWARGRDFTGATGVPWTPEQSKLSETAQAAFHLNLLTEDNLPSYHYALAIRFGLDTAWGTWVRRWTAEEARHATAIRDYLIVSRAIDPVALERDRMATMQAGWRGGDRDLLRSLVYVSLQELATRIAHRNTGRVADDPVADRLLLRIAADENLHMVFYRDLVGTAFAIAPDQVMVAIAAEITTFQMPGAGIPGSLRRSLLMAEAGIYDVRIYRDEVVIPLLRQWNVFERKLTTSAADAAQTDLAHQLDRLETMAKRFEVRRASRQQAATRGSA
jgi:acyl-[acyl-carrier-protein] desaturase